MTSGHESPLQSCPCCPHYDSLGASCDHDLRQSLIMELAASPSKTCPIYQDYYADEMRRLADEFDGG